MAADRPLAEVVAEGRAMCRPDWQGPKGYRDTFIAEHFARLLAVAEAAMEWAMADDEYDAVPPSSRDTDAFESNLFRRQAARRALLHAAAGAREGEER